MGKYCDQTTQFEAGQPIRLMNEMGELIFDEVLEPGDVLYVPTNLSHYGVAVEDCLTFRLDLDDLPHYSCSIVWQMSLPILMI